MKEQEWFVSTNLEKMLKLVHNKRQLRLLSIAMIKPCWHLLEARTGYALEVNERFADGNATVEEMYEVFQGSCRAYHEAVTAFSDYWRGNTRSGEEPHPKANILTVQREARHAVQKLGFDPLDVIGIAFSTSYALTNYFGFGEKECRLLREIVGNPYRTYDLSKYKNNPIAQEIYETQDFSSMSVLADNIEDQGCDNPEILGHLRSNTKHVRGCWVLDRLL